MPQATTTIPRTIKEYKPHPITKENDPGCPPAFAVEGHSYLANIGNDSATISFHNGVEKITMGSISHSYDYTLKDRVISDSNGGKFDVSADGMEITGVVTYEGRVFKRIE